MNKSFSSCGVITAIVTVSISATSAVGAPALASDGKPLSELTFGVVPQQSASRLAKVWVPILKGLSEKTGLPVRFVTAKDIPTFERCLAIGAYDVAYMNPLHYVHFHEISGYEAIAHRKGKRLKGILVSRRDSDISGILDLDGSELAFPSPAAFGASVLPRAELKQKKVFIETKYVNSHDSVYRAVASGIMTAGGGVMRTFNTVSASIRSQLKVIYQTDAYTPHAIAHRKGLPVDLTDGIKKGLLALGKGDVNELSALGFKAFQAATDKDWEDVRGLNIPPSDFDIRQVRRVQCH